MKERPILFSAPMVCAILEGRKTQTRRDDAYMLKYPPAEKPELTMLSKSKAGEKLLTATWEATNGKFTASFCPYGKPGDRLWVRETWQAWHKTSHEYDEWEPIGVKDATASKQQDFEYGPTCDAIEYKATSESIGPWTPSIHMPRWASRITLEITDVRVERLQDISAADCRAEGCAIPSFNEATLWRRSYRDLWELINGHGSWDVNPWVWVIEFKRV